MCYYQSHFWTENEILADFGPIGNTEKKALIRLWATFEGWVWVGQIKTSMNSGNTLAKSNCTHYSTLSGPPDIILGSGT